MTDLVYLLGECAKNNERSQKIIYDRYFALALKTAFRYVDSYDNAAHAANDAFIKMFKALKVYEVRSKDHAEPMFITWLKKIVIHAALDLMEKENAGLKTAVPYDDAWAMKDSAANGEDNVMYKELINLVRKLTPAYRAVFNLHVIDGYSHPEIAKILGISVGASKSNLSKARAILQKHLVTAENTHIICLT